MGYQQLVEPILDGLRSAETDLGVGFRLVIAINRHDSASSALELVDQIIAHPYDEVVGLGMDDLTPEGTEDPLRFAKAYARAKEVGLRLTAHVGETDGASATSVRDAIDELHCDRIDHGYRVIDDPDLTRQARERGIPFTTTPFSTTICSGWTLGPDHRIARMIREGLAVTVSSDDAMFFRTDVGREYREGLPLLGVDAAGAKRIALAGIDAAFCDDDTKARLHRQFNAEILTLETLLPPTPYTPRDHAHFPARHHPAPLKPAAIMHASPRATPLPRDHARFPCGGPRKACMITAGWAELESLNTRV
jgi:adenosine deaminase